MSGGSIFAVVCSATPELRSAKLFGTVELARAHLKKLADERRYNLGVHWHEETEDMFHYTLGWEEHSVRFSVVELHVEGLLTIPQFVPPQSEVKPVVPSKKKTRSTKGKRS